MNKSETKINQNNGLTTSLNAQCNPAMKEAFKKCYTEQGYATEAEALRDLVRNFIEINKQSQEKTLN